MMVVVEVEDGRGVDRVRCLMSDVEEERRRWHRGRRESGMIARRMIDEREDWKCSWRFKSAGEEVEPQTWNANDVAVESLPPNLWRYELSRCEFSRKRSRCRCRWWSAKPRVRVPIAKSVEREDSHVSRVPCVITVSGPGAGWSREAAWAVNCALTARCRVRWREDPCWMKEIEFERGDGDETRRCMASWNGEAMSS